MTQTYFVCHVQPHGFSSIASFGLTFIVVVSYLHGFNLKWSYIVAKIKTKRRERKKHVRMNERANQMEIRGKVAEKSRSTATLLSIVVV